MIDLRGRVALVTGAGRGIGAAYARALASSGAVVMVNDNGTDVFGVGSDESVALAVAESICEAGGLAYADHNDVSGFAGAAAAVGHTTGECGRIDIVVNNAGIIGERQTIAEVSEQHINQMLAVHTIGTIGTIRAAFPYLHEQGFGRIINTVSEAAFSVQGNAGLAYGAAKAAVWGITAAAAGEAAGSGVTVNAISPGAMTRMSKPYLDKVGVPPGLDLSPDHIARVVVCLCGADAATINGAVIHAAGGHIREYLLHRVDDSQLVHQLLRATAEVVSGHGS